VACSASSAAVKIPSPATDEPAAKSKGSATVVLAGVVFWAFRLCLTREGGHRRYAGYSGGSAGTLNMKPSAPAGPDMLSP